MTKLHLIADVGATNARFALVSDSTTELLEQLTLPASAYANMTEATQAYLHKIGNPKLAKACIAIAGPAHKPRFTLANNDWQVDKADVEQLLNCDVFWLNDFAVQAWGVTGLQPSQQLVIKSGTAKRDGNRLVIGPGSGLGVAGLVNEKGHWVTVTGEGGHVSFAPSNSQEIAVLEYLLQRYEHVSVERVASGSGIPVLYQALAQITDQASLHDEAAAIANAAMQGDGLAGQTMDMFFSILGKSIASAALQIGATGGIYLVGGILPKLQESLLASQFTDSFSRRGRLSNYLEDIPIVLSLDSDLGLKGAALALAAQEE